MSMAFNLLGYIFFHVYFVEIMDTCNEGFEIKAYQGSTVLLHCPPSLEIPTWSRLHVAIHSHDKIAGQMVNQSASLEVLRKSKEFRQSNISKRDAGLYRCDYIDKNFPKQILYCLKVLEPPYIFVSIVQNASVTCDLSDNKYNYTLTKLEHRSSNDELLRSFVVPEVTSFNIGIGKNSPSYKKDGFYACIYEKSRKDSYYLQLYSRQEYLTFPGKPDCINVDMDELRDDVYSMSLLYRIYSSYQMNFTMFKDEIVRNSSNVTIGRGTFAVDLYNTEVNISVFEIELKIGTLKEQNYQRNYIMVAQNQFGKSNCSIELHLSGKQDLPVLIGQNALREPEKLRLETTFYSQLPPLSIVWYQNHRIIEDNITLSASLSKTKTYATFYGSPMIRFRYKADIVIQLSEFDQNENFSCHIRNSDGNEVVKFSTEEIRDSLRGNVSNPQKKQCPISSNDGHSLTTPIIAASCGGTVVVLSIFVFWIKIVKIWKSNSSKTVITVNNVEEEEHVKVSRREMEIYQFEKRTSELEHDQESQGVSLSENSYQEVGEIELSNVEEQIAVATSNSNSSLSETTSERSYLDMGPHPYEDIDQANTELHEYLSCYYNLT